VLGESDPAREERALLVERCRSVQVIRRRSTWSETGCERQHAPERQGRRYKRGEEYEPENSGFEASKSQRVESGLGVRW
jgi:hypothetical protein